MGVVFIMQNSHASFKYVHSQITVYHSSKVDQKWRRAIHCCGRCSLGHDQPQHGQNETCGAIHYGYCSPVTVPPKSLQNQSPQPTPQASRTSSPPSPQTRHTSSPQIIRAQGPQSVQVSSFPGPRMLQNAHVVRGTPNMPMHNVHIIRAAPNIQAPSTPQKLQTARVPQSVQTVHSPQRVRTQTPRADTPPPQQNGPKVSLAPVKVSNRENELNAREKEINAKDNKQKDTATKDKDVFLKQKEAQLKEKREREARENFSDKRDNKSSSQQRTQGQTPPQTHIQTLQHKPQLRNAGKPENIPQFYFPMGRPVTGEQQEKIVQRIKEAFSKFENGKVTSGQMGAIAKACQLSFYWRCPLFLDAGGQKTGFITLQMFLSRWKKLCQTCHDDAAKFVALLSKPGCNYLVAEDFIPLIQDVVDTHPGLTFLHDAPEFHSRYVHTVIARIFYCVNRSWTGRLTPAELRRSNLLQVLQLVEEEDDINRITDYFSYEHFYVIYCKFWELDTDHDLFISKEDLSRHNEHAISTRMIERIFSGAVTRGHAQKEGKMSYTEFVWFLLSEEDKRHPTSIEYWFRCMDLDGDGVLSMYELEYFYEEQVQKMEALGIETLPFEDCLCQADTVVPAVCDHPFIQEKMLDMVSPRETGKITMRDLKACKMTPLFYDTFFNLEKYLDHEQKDPFANARDHESDEPEMSDWERYAAEEYEILVAEEGANDLGMDEINYEDDFEPDDEEMQTLPVEALQLAEPPQRKGRPRPTSPDDDIYDFSNKDLGY